jgi:hypothetical protein
VPPGGHPADMRAVFVLYLVVIVTGITYCAVIGLTHN